MEVAPIIIKQGAEKSGSASEPEVQRPDAELKRRDAPTNPVDEGFEVFFENVFAVAVPDFPGPTTHAVDRRSGGKLYAGCVVFECFETAAGMIPGGHDDRALNIPLAKKGSGKFRILFG